MQKTPIRLGAINWDAALPKDTYFGGYTIRNLGNEKYKSRLPYFATEQDGKFDIPYRTQADYDKELMYAIEGGIDFFAYCWYPDSNGDRTIWHDDKQYEFLVQYYPELNAARKLYQSSKLNSKMNLCTHNMHITCTKYIDNKVCL